MKNRTRLRTLSFGVMIYMLLAFGWWSILLHKKNKEVFIAKKNLIVKNFELNEIQLEQNEDYITLFNKYTRQKYMINGEGLVFVISVCIGMWFIYRGYRRQVEIANEKRNFLLSITHELKSPLAALKISADTIAKRELSEAQKKLLNSNNIKDIDRLQKLVENLLLAAKVESNYQPVSEYLNLTQLLNSRINTFQSQYQDGVFNLHAEEDTYISADRMGLISVIDNLIGNAIKYSIGPVHVDITVHHRKDGIDLLFADQGIGIPYSERNKVFDRFYRVGSEETRKSKGTGLGLYIVDQIAQKHNWHIRIMDNEPRGTTIGIRINQNNIKLTV